MRGESLHHDSVNPSVLRWLSLEPFHKVNEISVAPIGEGNDAHNINEKHARLQYGLAKLKLNTSSLEYPSRKRCKRTMSASDNNDTEDGIPSNVSFVDEVETNQMNHSCSKTGDMPG